jgi:hypothetical protein
MSKTGFLRPRLAFYLPLPYVFLTAKIVHYFLDAFSYFSSYGTKICIKKLQIVFSERRVGPPGPGVLALSLKLFLLLALIQVSS